MAKYTIDELRKKRGKTDYSRIADMDDETLERLIDQDVEERQTADNADLSVSIDWRDVVIEAKAKRASVHLRVDEEVLKFFKSQGKGHITRMQEVLKSYVDAQRPR